jgi:glycine hydroxymethyltransferase
VTVNSNELLDLIQRFHTASVRRLHLIPSENPLSSSARLPYVADLAARYSFPADGPNWGWPGNDDLALVEQAAVDGLRALLGAAHVNVKPVSGLSAMTVALSALSQRGGTVLSISEADGGHGSTRFVAEQLGRHYRSLPVDRDRYAIDTSALAAIMDGEQLPRPVLVYLDQFMCLFPHDLGAIRAAVGADTLICYDASHVLGLIAGGQFQDPLREGADVLTASTHKSLPGPHKGVLATNRPDLAQLLDDHAGHWVSHHHPADVAALAIVVADMLETAPAYAERTIGNAQALAEALAETGFAVCARPFGFTRSHQLWIDIDACMPAAEASRRLLAAGIVVNAIDVPYLDTGVGLRLGVQEAAARGMGAAAMQVIAELMHAVLFERAEPRLIAPAITELLDTYPNPGDELLTEFAALAWQSAAKARP